MRQGQPTTPVRTGVTTTAPVRTVTCTGIYVEQAKYVQYVHSWLVSPRGAGYHFGHSESQQFLHLNDLGFICRAHQLVNDGYNWSHNNQVVTIFSAPNYCYRCGNNAALLDVGEQLQTDFTRFMPADRRGEPQAVRKAPDYFL
eukprot:GHVS01041048.1.p2 GENE.GHVS01041048.1~~GHVS01041048.1.p2  ORF type:complete len:143 (-),score=16.16 GHVS01041048.1:640-1068(-)